MDNITLVALVGVLSTAVVAPFVQSWLRRKEKQQEYDRQDQLAAALKHSAESVATNSAALLEESKKGNELLTTANEQTGVVDSKLNVIHSLVDGGLTAQMQSELASLNRELVLLNEKPEPRSEGTDAAIKLAEARIAELTDQIAKRQSAASQAGDLFPASGALADYTAEQRRLNGVS